MLLLSFANVSPLFFAVILFPLSLPLPPSLCLFLFAFCFGHLSLRGKLVFCLDEYANIFWAAAAGRKKEEKMR